jgi:molybdate transport system ATP-binding protein
MTDTRPSAPAIDAHLSFTVGDVGRTFRVDAELKLEAGVLVLFGPSGVGKTLTLRALAGLIDVTSGYLRIASETLLDTARGVFIPAHQRRVGYVPQQQALFPFLDVAANVAFGLPRPFRRGARVQEWLAELGIAHLSSVRPASLSGGERQRVALARALATMPRMLLLDEPFASIDEEGSAALREVLREVLRRHNIPAVLVTHDADEALALGDRVVLFARGKTAENGAPRAMIGEKVLTARATTPGTEIDPGGTEE